MKVHEVRFFDTSSGQRVVLDYGLSVSHHARVSQTAKADSCEATIWAVIKKAGTMLNNACFDGKKIFGFLPF